MVENVWIISIHNFSIGIYNFTILLAVICVNLLKSYETIIATIFSWLYNNNFSFISFLGSRAVNDTPTWSIR